LVSRQRARPTASQTNFDISVAAVCPAGGPPLFVGQAARSHERLALGAAYAAVNAATGVDALEAAVLRDEVAEAALWSAET
jgi:hypothetical protein